MKKKNALALGVLMTCLIVGNIGHAKVYGREDVNKNEWNEIKLEDSKFTNPIAEKFYNSGENNILNTNITSNDKRFGVLAYNTAVLDIIGTNINVDAKNVDGVAGIAADTISYFEKNNSGANALKQFTDGGTINLGTSDTNTINITATSQTGSANGIECMRSVNDPNKNGGIFAEPSFVNVKGENLIINAHSDKYLAAGIWAQNNTGDINNPSTVTIDAKNTIINSTSGITEPDKASGEYYNLGIVAYSSSKVIINNNLTVNAGTAISTRGNATTIINQDGTGTVKINGDINFNYDKPTSGTAVDATVDINLTNAESYLNGNIFVNGNPFPPEGKDEVNAMQLALSNEAQWNTDADSFVNNLKLDGGIVNVQTAGQKVTVDNLNGNGGTVNFGVNNKNNELKTGSLVVSESAKGTNVTANYTGITADDVVTKDKFADLVKTSLKANGDATFTAKVQDGLITPGMSGITTNGADGNTLDVKDIQQGKSTATMDGMRDIAATAIVAWRQEDSTLSQRLGELRESDGDQGVWVRMMRGEFEYGGAYKNQYNYFQMGYDKAYGDWHYGAALSHNDGQTAYANGSGDNRSTSLSLYGTWLGERGHYADIVLKEGRLNNEFEIHTAAGDTSGDYGAWGTSLSGEYGMKLGLDNGWYVTPQAQLTFMRIGGEDYTTSNGIEVSQDTLYSTVGRVGFELGKKVSDRGSVYAKASLMHEFAGDADTYLRLGDLSNSYSQDIGNTWYEAGFGVNYKTTENSYLYADVVKTFGDDIKTPWQWNAGMRWSF